MKEEFWRSIFNIADTMRENHPLSGNKAIIHLTYNQLRMIRHVYVLTLKKPNGIPLKTLAESLNITPAAASEMVMFLIKKDVLESEKNPEDMRSILIRISHSIAEIIKDGEKMFRRKTADFLATIPPEEREILIKRINEFSDCITAK